MPLWRERHLAAGHLFAPGLPFPRTNNHLAIAFTPRFQLFGLRAQRQSFALLETLANGKPLKEEKRTALKTWDGKRTYQQVKVTNLRKEHSTAIKVLEEKNDTGVKKKTFSKRWLVRGI